MKNKSIWLLVVILILCFGSTSTLGHHQDPPAWGSDYGIITKINTSQVHRFDPAKGEVASISYTLTQPVLVFITVHGQNPPWPLRRILVNWEAQDASTQVVEWDGRDASGNILNPKKNHIRFKVEPLPVSVSSREADRILSDPEHRWGHLHQLHEIDKCGFFKLDLQTPNTAEILSGIVPIKAKVIGDFKGYSSDWGFGVRYFVDDEVVHEEMVEPSNLNQRSPAKGKGKAKGKGAKPQFFAIDLDTTAFENGEHTITLNICDHNEHEGTASVTVNFQN